MSSLGVNDAWVPRADFHGIFFWNVELDSWSFQEAKLNDADFEGATLKNCSFEDAELNGANFNGAKIINPTALTKAQLRKAKNVDAEVFKVIGT